MEDGLSVETARALRAAGLRWDPAPGDRFVVDQPELTIAVFVLSDMTVDVHHLGGERVLGFNGTTEWALDSVRLDEALWLPAEHQLRSRLGGTFRRLVRRGEGYAVVTARGEDEQEHSAGSPAEAYAAALLTLIRTAAAPA